MGIYVNGILGPFSGKLGNVIGSSWRSTDYMRSLPTPSSGKVASAKQTLVRKRFAMAVEFINPLRDLVNLSFLVKKGSKKSGFDIAIAQIIDSIEITEGDLNIVYEKIQLAQGSLSPAEVIFSTAEDGQRSFIWKPKISIGTAEGNDIVYIVMYSSEKKDYFVFSDMKRSDGMRDIGLDEVGKGSFHVWTFTSTHDCTRFSNSVYNGTLVLNNL